jgi:hypothetical protein
VKNSGDKRIGRYQFLLLLTLFFIVYKKINFQLLKMRKSSKRETEKERENFI